MKTAVCIKYVPVISRMQFDYEAKTIVRDGVPSEVNPFDLLGVVRAAELKSGPDDEVVVLTMGPPGAAEGLTDCLALGADRAVLVTDRALAGSDTLATSRALALALAREQPDLIICGRNSTDGETGQVGPEVAELLGLPHLSHVRKLDLSADRRGVVAERITDEGFQVLECSLPAVVCVTEGVAPELYPSQEQMEGAQSKPTSQVSAADLTSDTSLFGAEGSPTWVNEIRLVEPNRLGVRLEDAEPGDAAKQVADSVRDRLAELAQANACRLPGRVASIPGQPGAQRLGSRGNHQRRIGPCNPGDAGQGPGNDRRTESEVVAVVIASNGESLAQTLADQGADRVLVLDNSSLGPVCSRAVGQALAAVVDKERPYAILFASTADGRDLAARLAAKLELGLTGDAIDLEIDDEGRLVQLKPALGGNVVAPILSKTTAQPGHTAARTAHPGCPGTRCDSLGGAGPCPAVRRDGRAAGQRRIPGGPGRTGVGPGPGGAWGGYGRRRRQRGPCRRDGPAPSTPRWR